MRSFFLLRTICPRSSTETLCMCVCVCVCACVLSGEKSVLLVLRAPCVLCCAHEARVPCAACASI